MPLTEKRRQQLDGIVAQMEANGEAEADIRFVVGDFKQKYEAEAKPADGALTATVGERLAMIGDVAKEDIRRVRDFTAGIGAGVASTALHGGDLIRRATGMERIIDRPENQALMTPPPSFSGATGKLAEQIGEFAAPLSAVSKGVKALPWAARMAAEGVAGAGVAGVQSGGDPQSMAIGAVAPAGLSVAGKTAGATGRALINIAGKAVPGPLRARVLTTQALRPRNTRIKFDKSADLALPLVKEAEQTMGKPIEVIEDFIQGVDIAQKQNRVLYRQIVGQAADEMVDGTPIAEAIERSIPKLTKLENPAEVARIRATADVYRRHFSVEDLDDYLREANAVLESYEAKFPAAKSAALRSNPETAQDFAKAAAIRTELYKAIDAPGQGAAARELQRRWGALNDLKDAAWRRKNVADRAQTDDLTERLSKVGAAMQVGRAGLRALHGDVAGAAVDVGGAVAGRALARAIKEAGTTNNQLRRAMESVRTVPSRIDLPPPPVPRPVPVRQGEIVEPQAQVAGPAPYAEGQFYEPAQLALPATGARPMPPSQRPDPSYVRAVPATPARTMRQPRALPPAPSVREMPASSRTPPDPSYVRAVKAEYAKKVGRRTLTPEDYAEIEKLITARPTTKAATWKVEQTHKPTEELFSAVLADAKKQGYPGSPGQLRAAYKAAVEDAKEHLHSAASSQEGAHSHALLLKEIRRRGGISIAREGKQAGGLRGELATLIEGNRGRAGAFGPGVIVGKGARSKIDVDRMATLLSDVPGLGHIKDPNALLAALKDAEQYYTHGGTEARLSLSQALEEIGVRPGTPWWTRFEIPGDPTFPRIE